MIEVSILKDSINSTGNRITTYLLTYPRFIHAELLTHRVFSRNSSSSRAIPFSKMVDKILENPAMPIFWGKTQKGMQSEKEIDQESIELCKNIWKNAMYDSINYAKKLNELGLHKQICNRIIEPYFNITVVLTGTEFGNFFNLRAHKDAQPEFQELAFKMLELYNYNKPEFLETGCWHIPFSEKMPKDFSIENQLKVATARCARTSYLTFNNEINFEDDFRLHDALKASGHWSPFEHCAQALDSPVVSGNFVGWLQYRKTFLNENRKTFSYQDLNNRRVTNAKNNSMG